MRRALVSSCSSLLVLLAACARVRARVRTIGSARIRGEVVLAPLVSRGEHPEPVSGPSALAGVPVRVVDADGNVRASGVSDDRGAFTIDVAPGAYLLTAVIEEDPARSVKPVRVQVRAGEVVRSDVTVDSGIR